MSHGFDTYLQQAVHPEWAEHYVDYVKIKRTIQFYMERRKQLEQLMGDDDDEYDGDQDDLGNDQYWTKEDMFLLDRRIEEIAPAVSTAPLPHPITTTTTTTTTRKAEEEGRVEAGDYFRYEDVPGTTTTKTSIPGATTPTGTRTLLSRRRALLRLAQRERADMITLLEQEGTKASYFYQAQLAKLEEWIGPSMPPPPPPLSKQSSAFTDPTSGSSSAGGSPAVEVIPPLQRLERWITRQSVTPTHTTTTTTTTTDLLGIELPTTTRTPTPPAPQPTELSTIPLSSPRSTLADQVVEEEEDDEEHDFGDQTIHRKDPYEIGMELLQVFSFVVANVITLRQCLIRYDAFARTYDGLKILRGGIWVADDELFGTAGTLSDPVVKDAIQRAKAMLASSSYASESSLLESRGDPPKGDFSTVVEVVAERRTLFGRLCATPRMTAATACGGGDGLMKEDTAATGGTTIALRNNMDNKLRDRMTIMFHLGPLMNLQSTFLNQLTRPHEAIVYRHQFYLRCSDLRHQDDLSPEAEEALSARLAAYDSMFRIPNALEYSQTFSAQLNALGLILDKASTDPAATFSDPLVVRDQFVYLLRRYFLLGSRRNGLVLEPKMLLLRGRSLKKEMHDIAEWRARLANQYRLHSPDVEAGKRRDEDDDDDNDTSKAMGGGGGGHHGMGTYDNMMGSMKPENVLPLVLNLVSCFLFMMNNYVIEPSSAYYANALGSSDAMSGIMIGAAPWFAMISAVVYSFWTNTSYKMPILFSASLMVIGNILYSTAYSYTSMEMCLIGRAITGLGAPRVINRRYVADATPFHLRTASSAAFATATALGSALGPGTAIILDLFDFKFHVPGLGQQTFNGMTGPGYFMALCWGVYLLCILFFFTEPTRSGLDELVRREAVALVAGTEDATSKKKALMADYKGQGVLFEGSDTFQSSDASSLDGLPLPLPPFEKQGGGICHCIRHMTPGVAICMSLMFMKRIALESIVASTSIITKNRYGWNIRNVGGLHLLNGIIVIPVTILSGWLSQYKKDRYLALHFICITLFGMSFLVDLTDLVNHTDSETYNEGHWLAVGPHKYIIGSLIAFSGIEACESYVASLMSKVVPSALAVGTFNSGLLATLVGTGGRATGDLFITSMGLISIRNLLNLLVIPGMSLMILSIFLIRWNYSILAI